MVKAVILSYMYFPTIKIFFLKIQVTWNAIFLVVEFDFEAFLMMIGDEEDSDERPKKIH